MAEQRPDLQSGHNSDANIRPEPGGGSAYATPHWVKVFGLIAVVLLVVVAVVLVTGLGGPHGPGRHMASGSLTDIGGPAAAAEADRTVEVTTLDTMAFEPSHIDVAAGETITFHVTNAGQVAHEFTLGDAAMQQAHAEEMAEMEHAMAHDTSNSITVQPGETKEVTWRFGAAGLLEFACHQPGHYPAGMRGQITVR
jgi:uncharacterized cupredoxin-like copper-binding protein